MNNQTIRYSVKDNNFKYHFIKGELKATGSVISKEVHPNSYVERFKTELKGKCIYEKNDGLYLKRNIKTGVLMAKNLCSNENITEFNDNNDAIVLNHNSKRDRDFKDTLVIKNVIPSFNDSLMLLKSHEYKLDKIEKYSLDYDFFKRIGGKELSKAESFVVDVLSKNSIIKDYRRGNDFYKEADIVESEERQIEIVSCFNDVLKSVQFRKGEEEEASLLDCVDIGRYSIPQGVIKKFTEKEYTNNFAKELAILLIGGNTKSIELIKQLEEELKKNNVKNEFEKYYIIIIDIYSDKVTLLDGGIVTDSIYSFEPLLYSKEKILLTEISEDESYLMTLTNVFKNDMNLFFGLGKEIINFIKDYNVWLD